MIQIPPVLPEGVQLDDLLEVLRSLSWGASDILMAYARGVKPPYGFSEVLEVDHAQDGPVSAADLAVNSWLLDGLLAKFPRADWELLTEESFKKDLLEGSPIEMEWLWIIDPLDGTKDFLEGTGEYAVHLALVQGNRPVLGVVVIPELEELWFGVIGQGAWVEKRDGSKNRPAFSNRKKMDDLILVASKSHRDERLESLIARLGIKSSKAIGSVGGKIASILRGEADFYISLSGKTAPKDWDMAAPEVVLLSAGGRFTHADGSQLSYNTGDVRQIGCLIASNGNSHDQLCRRTLKEIKLIDPQFGF